MRRCSPSLSRAAGMVPVVEVASEIGWVIDLSGINGPIYLRDCTSLSEAEAAWHRAADSHLSHLAHRVGDGGR